MRESIYLEFLNLNDESQVKNFFFSTLLETNHDYGFFVDWSKVKDNVKKFDFELNLLNALIRNPQFDETLIQILKRYPEVLPCIPLLLAVRGEEIKIVEDLFTEEIRIIDFIFSNHDLKDREIGQILVFFEKTGLKKFFMELATSSLKDYLYGIEVGTDSNARKNRSGQIVEIYLHKKISEIIEKAESRMVLIEQQYFKNLNKNVIPIPRGLEDRKFDVVIIKPGKAINIEMNFYNVGGSKPQEIVDSYINRQRELKRTGWDFIWVTDGPGWKTGRSQMEKALNEIDFVLNLKMVNVGLLEKILRDI
ncbi:MAG: type II restriction endonuclease [Candidatus Saccharicenans sp.]|nr:type II restriction endonuclease [Candidatus Saccharicenans sp.]